MRLVTYSLVITSIVLFGCTSITQKEDILIKYFSEERLLSTGLIEIGDPNAPIVLMMFTEHHCKYCKNFNEEHFPLLIENYISSGKMRVQIGILPIEKYITSENTTTSLICAAKQGKGIPMHKLLFKLGAKDRDAQLQLATTLELDTNLFTKCLDSTDTARIIERQKSLADSLDVTLVPTFFINGEKSIGLPYYADLRGMIERQLTINN